MHRLLHLAGLCGVLAAPAAALAADMTTPQAATREVPTSVESPADHRSLAEQAARWGLRTDEYERYQTAIAGIRGRISDPHITPIEVLGIEARTDEERRRYAEMYVQMMRADTEKVLAYSRAVQEAWDRLQPAAPLIDLERIDAFRASRGSLFPALTGRRGEPNRLIVFTKTACQQCDGTIRRVLRQVGAGRAEGADIYVLDVPPGQDDTIRRWARSIDVPPDLVGSGTVTLNYETGQLQQVAQTLRMSPATFPFVVARSPQGTLTTASLPGD